MGVAEESKGLRGMWRSRRDRTSERDTERGDLRRGRQSGGGERVQGESEGGLVMSGGTVPKRREKEIRIYLQLPCEMLMGSLSSGKPAPAICSSVK